MRQRSGRQPPEARGGRGIRGARGRVSRRSGADCSHNARAVGPFRLKRLDGLHLQRMRPPLLLVGVIAGWGWVISVCDGAGLDLARVLGGPCQKPSSTYHAALILVAVILAAHLVHFLASEAPGLTWRPWLCCNLALQLLLLALGASPFQAFFSESRLSLVRTQLRLQTLVSRPVRHNPLVRA